MSDPKQTTANQQDKEAVDEHVVLDEVREAYRRARSELKDTTDRLRTEIQKIDVEKVGESAKNWVKENPGLAFFLAVGAGMVVGRALTKAMEPPPPPSISERARRTTSKWTHSARHLTDDAQDRLARQAMEAGEQVADRMRTFRSTMNERKSALSDAFQQRADDLSAAAAEKTNDLIVSFSDAAERAADSLQIAARDLSKSLKRRKRSQQGLFEALAYAAKTVFGAFVFKRLSDWIRERY